MKIFNLVRSEFKKNYSKKKLIIITLFLLLSTICFVEIYKWANESRFYTDRINYGIDGYEFNCDLLLKKDNRTNLEELEIMYYKDAIKYYKYLKEIKAHDFSYQNELVDSYLLRAKQQNKIIDDIKENGKDVFSNNCEYLNKELNKSEYLSESNSIYHTLCDRSDEDLKKTYQDNLKEIEMYEKILYENKYYVYLDEFKIVNDYIPLLKEKKVESENDFRAINYRQYNHVRYSRLEQEIISEDMFTNGKNMSFGKVYDDATYEFDNYKNYLRYQDILKKEAEKNKEILIYSTKNDIKHDISYYYDDLWQLRESQYITSKTCINNIFHLSVIVLIIVSITSGGIVSREHNSGTIKNIITTPVKRWKILLSKFIYLILHTYIIWFMLLIIFVIYTGIRLGFSDIFSPKLLYRGGRVVEVNYILYLIKDMLVAGLPMIAFLSILFMLSTVTLNTQITVGITTILSIISPIIWFVIYTTKLYFIKYIPIFYFDLGFILNKSKEYSIFLKNTSIDINLGIIVSLICIVVCYFITNIIYIKRDIKN